MNATQVIRMLARYNAWANETLFDAVAALPAGEADKARPPLTDLPVFRMRHPV